MGCFLAWIRLDDQIAHHPKFLKAGPVASWLWVTCVGYAQKFLTDGFIPTEALPTLGTVSETAIHAATLVQVGLLEPVDGGFQIHDYLEFNDAASVVKEKRRLDRVRKESERNPNGIRPVSSRARPRPIPSHPIRTKEEDLSLEATELIVAHERKSKNGNGSLRSKHPVFSGQRITVFEWQFDDFTRILGPLTDGFHLDEWFYTLDAEAVQTALVIPQRDGGAWLQAQLIAEAQRRGLPIVSTQIRKETHADRMVAAVRNARAAERQKS